MAKDYSRREHLKNYDAGVIKDKIISLANELEAMGFKRDANTLNRIGQDLEIWQHK